MKEAYTLPEIDQIASSIQGRLRQQPKAALVLGSGLGDLAESVQNPVTIPYADVPDWPISTVLGHQGKIVSGSLEGRELLVLQGRVHYYEGYSMAQVTLWVRVMQRLGVETMIVTNAAGAINPEYNPGDLMLITDHLSLMVMGGANPLRGANLDDLGVRFPDMSQAYDRVYLDLARKVAADQKLSLREGVYAGLAGPSFETPADLRFLRAIGADAVGMSTVPEVIVARHGGTRVLGISGISNKANLDGNTITTHQEVLAAGKVIVPKLTALIRGVLANL